MVSVSVDLAIPIRITTFSERGEFVVYDCAYDYDTYDVINRRLVEVQNTNYFARFMTKPWVPLSGVYLNLKLGFGCEGR